MSSTSRIAITLLFSLSLLSPVFAQTRRQNAQTSVPIVTVTTSNGRVRYASLGEVNQTRLQVFSPEGSQVYDSEYRLGNLIDWPLLDQQGQHLTDGSYLFLITVKDFSALLTQKYGTALLENDQVSLQQIGRDELLPAQAVALQANKVSEVLAVVDRIGSAGPAVPTTAGHDGDAVIDAVRSAKQKEVTIPQPIPVGESVTGTGVQNKVPKWTDNAGTLGDSGIFDTGSNIGIGTVSPTSGKLQVAGGATTALRLDANPGVAAMNIGGTGEIVVDAPSVGAGRFVVKDSGNVGIGTAGPGDKLHVKGNLRLEDPTDATTRDQQLSVDPSGSLRFIDTVGGERMRINWNGNVGVGTSVPNDKFHVKGILRLEDPTDTTTRDLQLSVDPSGSLRFIDTVGGEKMRINWNGNVGIGTNNPASKLDVNGDISVTGNAVVSGNIAAKYQDVAEWVQARQPLVAGTVVSLDETLTNAVEASSRAYDTHVAGVVSTQPGVILGEGGPGRVLVSTTGRVMVKVNASRYPIRIGDLLVSSNKPGVAMRSRPIRIGGKLIHRPGTIIGKALEALPNGAGEILVLVSLQ